MARVRQVSMTTSVQMSENRLARGDGIRNIADLSG